MNALVFLACLLTAAATYEDQEFWTRKSLEELEKSLKINLNTNLAKNVILFVGDGMGPNTVVAARIYKGGESSRLIFEEFPHIGLLKTYTVDKQVPDSAATATALFTGIKNNYQTVGVDHTVKLNDCEASLEKAAKLKSFAEWALEAGKSTGFVTDARVTHATPSAIYAHSANRKWECDAAYPPLPTECKDIARQLVEDYPGNSLNVIMGGGRSLLDSNRGSKEDIWNCKRKDGRNLTEVWTREKKSKNSKYSFVTNNAELRSVDLTSVDYLMGIFAEAHLPPNFQRDSGPNGAPSLQEMTVSAIKVLNNNKNGFVLMVEGGLIDLAHHNGTAKVALDETVALNDAINATINLLKSLNIMDETLIIVTSDHTHSLSINGYPERGNNILGLAWRSKIDGMPFTTLSYTVTGKANYHYSSVDGKVVREDPSGVDTTAFSYHQQGSILNDENLHGGGDVVVYAIGPMAHLFHSIHEQTYVARVIAYAAKIGPHKNDTIKTFPSYFTIIICSVFLILICK